MREIRKIPVSPTHITTYKKQEFVKCSFCGVEAAGPQSGQEVEWKTKTRFEIGQTAIYWKDGDYYSESGSGVYHEIHACPDCFRDKVIPVLEKCALPEGTKFQETNWEW